MGAGLTNLILRQEKSTNMELSGSLLVKDIITKFNCTVLVSAQRNNS